MYTLIVTTDSIREFWQAYLDARPPEVVRGEPFSAEAFGDSPELADELLELVLLGRKTATCSSLWEWEAEGEAIPAPGALTICLDGAGRPRCVIETTEVRILPMDQVDAAFACAEGEGDLSLAYWRHAHERYFRRALPRIEREFAPDMPLVCERFRVVWPWVFDSVREKAVRPCISSS
jgi:uncharacterized protein YhfF